MGWIFLGAFACNELLILWNFLSYLSALSNSKPGQALLTLEDKLATTIQAEYLQAYIGPSYISCLAGAPTADSLLYEKVWVPQLFETEVKNLLLFPFCCSYNMYVFSLYSGRN